MKIVHISTGDSSGAGTCAYKLHLAMLGHGIDSKMVVLNKTTHDETVIEPFKKRRMLYKGIQKLFRLMGLYLSDYNKCIRKLQKEGANYTLPISIYDVASLKEVKEADILHLHLVDNFVDWRTFFKKVDKPMVWTLHDESFFYGISHYSDLFDLNSELEKKYYQIRRSRIKDAKILHIVFLSNYFKIHFGKDEMLSSAKSVRIISNSVDTSKYIMCDKVASREKWGIEKETVVLSFLASDITDTHKGLDILIQAVKDIPRNDIMILAIGKDSAFAGSEIVKTTGVVRDKLELSELLSASDYYVLPSLQESFSQSIIEAMACGCPVIAFPTGVAIDVVDRSSGFLCHEFTVESLKQGILHAMQSSYDRIKIRETVLQSFSKDKIVGQYIELYKELI